MVIVELIQDKSLSFWSPYLDWLQTFSESLLLLFAQINLTETDKRTLKTFHRKIVVSYERQHLAAMLVFII